MKDEIMRKMDIRKVETKRTGKAREEQREVIGKKMELLYLVSKRAMSPIGGL